MESGSEGGGVRDELDADRALTEAMEELSLGALPAGEPEAEERFVVTPSLLGKYFEMQCDKYLKLKATRVKRGPGGQAKEAEVESAHAEAVFERGNEFEDEVFKRLTREHRGKVFDLTHEGTNILFDVERIRGLEAACRIADADPLFHNAVLLFQPNVRAPPEVLESLLKRRDGNTSVRGREEESKEQEKKHNIELGLMKPDFLLLRLVEPMSNRNGDSEEKGEGSITEAPPSFEVVVIDVKSAMEVKLAHQIQVTFYAMVLEQVFKHMPTTGSWTVAEGRVWTPQRDSATEEATALKQGLISTNDVSLHLVEPYISSFFEEKASALLQTSSCPSWYMNEVSCGSCSNLESCTEEALTQRHINALPNLSLSNRRWLEGRAAQARKDGREELVDIEDIATLVREPHPIDSVRERIDNILLVAESGGSRRSPMVAVWEKKLKEKEEVVVPHVKPTRLLPPREEVAVVLDLFIDPRTASPMAASVVAWENGHIESEFTAHRKGYAVKTAEEEVHEEELAGEAILLHFAKHLHSLVTRLSGKKIQFYCESPEARATVLQALIRLSVSDKHGLGSAADSLACPTDEESANELPVSEVAWQLLLVLSDDPSLLATPLTRDDLEAVGLTVTNKSIRSSDWQAWLDRYGFKVAPVGKKATKDELMRAFLVGMLQRWSVDFSQSLKVGQLFSLYKDTVTERKKNIARSPPRLVELMTVFKALLSFPVPAFFTFSACASILLGEDLNDVSCSSIYELLGKQPSQECFSLLKRRASALWRAVEKTRDVVKTGCEAEGRAFDHTLVELPRECKIEPDCRLHNTYLRKLLFMSQYELVVQLEELRGDRIRGSPTVVLRPRAVVELSGKQHELICDIISGQQFVTVEGDGLAKSICYHENGSRELTTDVNFVDLLYSGIFSERLYSSKALAFTDIVDFTSSTVKLSLFGAKYFVAALKLSATPSEEVGETDVRLAVRPRLVDFNTKKKLSALFDCDSAYVTHLADAEEPLPFFLGLLERPNGIGAIPPQSERWRVVAKDIGEQFKKKAVTQLFPAELRVRFDKSQNAAYFHALQHRLQLVWGPPGTGKTFYLTRTVLRMFVAVSRMSQKEQGTFRVVVSAFTKTAIIHLLNELAEVLRRYRAYAQATGGKEFSPSVVYVGTLFENDTRTLELHEEITVALPDKAGAHWSIPFVVYGATAWQLHKAKAKMPPCDLLLIDEGSQLPLVDALIPISTVKPDTGAVIVVGDHLQLPPIIAGVYPEPSDEKEPFLYGSVLGGLMRDSEGKRVEDILRCMSGNAPPSLVKLTNNRRCNQALSRFLETLYGSNYLAKAKGEEHLSIVASPSAADPPSDAENRLLRAALLSHWQHYVRQRQAPLASLVTVVVSSHTEEMVAEQERVVEARVLGQLLTDLAEMAPRNVTKKKPCFVITPHRTQRYFTQKLLPKALLEKCKVDTVERMQGQEADVVVVSCCYFDSDVIALESDFIYHLRRLNVAFSRARKLVVLLLTPAVLQPGPEVLSTKGRREGYAHVLHFVRSSLRIDCTLALPESLSGGAQVVSGDQWLLSRTDPRGGPDPIAPNEALRAQLSSSA